MGDPVKTGGGDSSGAAEEKVDDKKDDEEDDDDVDMFGDDDDVGSHYIYISLLSIIFNCNQVQLVGGCVSSIRFTSAAMSSQIWCALHTVM